MLRPFLISSETRYTSFTVFYYPQHLSFFERVNINGSLSYCMWVICISMAALIKNHVLFISKTYSDPHKYNSYTWLFTCFFHHSIRVYECLFTNLPVVLLAPWRNYLLESTHMSGHVRWFLFVQNWAHSVYFAGCKEY